MTIARRWFLPSSTSAPPQRGRNMSQEGFEQVRVVVYAELVGDSQEQRVGLGDRFIRPELLDENLRFGGIAAAEDRAGARIDESDLVLAAALASKVGAVAIIHQR